MIFREWQPKPRLEDRVMSDSEWTNRQREADRAHYAQVEKNHGAALEAALSDSDYFKKEAKANALALNDARAESEKLKAGNKDLADVANAYRIERNELGAKLAEVKRERDELASSANVHRKERDDAMKHEDAANRLYQACLIDLGISNRHRDEARCEAGRWKLNHETAVKQRDEARQGCDKWADRAIQIAKERDEARAAYKSLVVTHVNAAACDDLMKQLDKAREALKSRCADGCEKTLSNLYRAEKEHDRTRDELKATNDRLGVVAVEKGKLKTEFEDLLVKHNGQAFDLIQAKREIERLRAEAKRKDELAATLTRELTQARSERDIKEQLFQCATRQNTAALYAQADRIEAEAEKNGTYQGPPPVADFTKYVKPSKPLFGDTVLFKRPVGARELLDRRIAKLEADVQNLAFLATGKAR